MSPDTEREVARKIDEMSRNGIIRPSDSPWGSRIILVRKKDGTQRFTADYSSLNSATKKMHPMPDTKDIFDHVAGSQIFSSLIALLHPGVSPSRKRTRNIQPSSQPGGSLNVIECHLGFVILRQPTNLQWTRH